MILLIGTVVGIFVAWRVRHLGLYVALCDALGVTFAGVAALIYAGNVAESIPLAHPLKVSACMLGVFALGWVMFRTVARSFAGDWAIDFGKHADLFGSMVAAFGATMMFVGVISTIFLTTGRLLDKIESLVDPLVQGASIAVAACKFVAFFAGGQGEISLEGIVLRAAGA